MKDSTYILHQTPRSLAADIINSIHFKENEKVLEPFRGEGAFYDQLPNYVDKYFSEIEMDMDFRDFPYNIFEVETIITNPPFNLQENNDRKRKNDFFIWCRIKTC